MYDFDRVFAAKKALITGGLGFIGSSLARRLVGLGAQVVVVDNLLPNYGGNLFNVHDINERIRINISDVRDESSMNYLVQGMDYLFNLAGQTSHMDSMQDPFTDLDINSRAQLSILEACRLHNPKIKVIFASTRQIYGKPDYLPVDEKHLLRPSDVNGINKMAGEWYHILYNNVYGLDGCALRLGNTFGPGMRIKDARQTFLGIWLRLLIEKKPFEVWGGEQLRDLNYVEDAVDAFLLAASSDVANGNIYNLGSSEVVSLKELAETLTRVAGYGDFIIKEFPADRKRIDIGDYYANYEAIKETLDWSPRVSLEEGLRRTVDYYTKNFEHYV